MTGSRIPDLLEDVKPSALAGPKIMLVAVEPSGDALGAARDLPVPPTTDNINGAETSVHGKLVRSNEEWLVLQVGDGEASRETWIPKQLVLLIKYHDH